MSQFNKHADAFGQLMAEYSALWDHYRRVGPDRTLDSHDKENVLSEDWAVAHYFATGADALRIVVKSLLAAELPPPTRILDFPCGSGRVLRHLRAMFPEAVIGACDLYQGHVDFCVKQFAAVPVASKEDLSRLHVGEWDVIFCGSLLTHLPETLFWSTMDFIIRSLSPNGIAVVTLEGRRTLFLQETRWKLISDDRFAFIREGYERTGFGYSDYDQQFREQKFDAQESYGVALVRADWLMAGLMKREAITVHDFCEADWDEHQDVVVIRRRPVSFQE